MYYYCQFPGDAKDPREFEMLCIFTTHVRGRWPTCATKISLVTLSRWWFQAFFVFTPTWGNDPIWLIFLQMGWNHQTVKFGVHILYGPFVTTPLYQTPSLSVSQIRPSAVTTNLRNHPMPEIPSDPVWKENMLKAPLMVRRDLCWLLVSWLMTSWISHTVGFVEWFWGVSFLATRFPFQSGLGIEGVFLAVDFCRGP